MKKLLQELAESDPKTSGPETSRARKKLEGVIKKEPAVAKVVKAAARLADFITPDDRANNARVIREAKEAIYHHYDKATKSLVSQPDHKTRLAATTLELAYDEGLPVKRSIVLSGSFKSAEEMMGVIQSSPEAEKALKVLSGLGINLEESDEETGPIIEMENRENNSETNSES